MGTGVAAVQSGCVNPRPVVTLCVVDVPRRVVGHRGRAGELNEASAGELCRHAVGLLRLILVVGVVMQVLLHGCRLGVGTEELLALPRLPIGVVLLDSISALIYKHADLPLKEMLTNLLLEVGTFGCDSYVMAFREHDGHEVIKQLSPFIARTEFLGER